MRRVVDERKAPRRTEVGVSKSRIAVTGVGASLPDCKSWESTQDRRRKVRRDNVLDLRKNTEKLGNPRGLGLFAVSGGLVRRGGPERGCLFVLFVLGRNSMIYSQWDGADQFHLEYTARLYGALSPLPSGGERGKRSLITHLGARIAEIRPASSTPRPTLSPTPR